MLCYALCYAMLYAMLCYVMFFYAIAISISTSLFSSPCFSVALLSQYLPYLLSQYLLFCLLINHITLCPRSSLFLCTASILIQCFSITSSFSSFISSHISIFVCFCSFCLSSSSLCLLPISSSCFLSRRSLPSSPLRWTIKARVTSKSQIRKWSNAKGEGHLFSIDLMDSSGKL